MPLFTYNRDIPDAPNNPSQDQPDMKTNTNSIDDIWKVDHYSFTEQDPQGRNSGGSHEKVQMPELGTIPTGTFATAGTFYVKSAASVAGNESQLFYTNSTSGNEYQLTRVDNANFATFGKLTADTITPDLTSLYGWTFLAGNGGNVVTPVAATGGLFLFYGRKSFNALNASVVFPFPFPVELFTITATIAELALGNERRVVIKTQSTAGFSFNTVTSTEPGTLNWMAIGR
jgi:hypothetical protein